MHRSIGSLLVIGLVLVGCGSSTSDGALTSTESATSAPSSPAEGEPTEPPQVDEEFTGSYSAVLNFTPAPESRRVPTWVTLLSGEKIVRGWFIPEDHPPVEGFVENGDLLDPPNDGVTFLIDVFEPVPGFSDPSNAIQDRTMDMILTIEDKSGSTKTVSISDAHFDAVS